MNNTDLVALAAALCATHTMLISPVFRSDKAFSWKDLDPAMRERWIAVARTAERLLELRKPARLRDRIIAEIRREAKKHVYLGVSRMRAIADGIDLVHSGPHVPDTIGARWASLAEQLRSVADRAEATWEDASEEGG